MQAQPDLIELVAGLKARGEAFCLATVVRTVSVTAAKAGAKAVIRPDGTISDGWIGGGTRIGESLASFNRWHAARVIHSRTCVMIMSDGYDTCEPKQLGAEMAALRRRCRRVVWLTPLIGWDGYEPSAHGMAAALPFIDLFAPAHTIESLAALEPYLSRL